MTTILEMTRKELLPMVRSAETEVITLNIIIDEHVDALLVAGRNEVKGHELAFAIPYEMIVSGQYRDKMRDTLRQLVTLLEYDYNTGEPKPTRRHLH